MRENNGGFLSGIIKGVLTSIIITLVGILIFAFIVKFALLDQSVIKSVNQFIKILSIFLGCVTAIRGSFGAIKGGIIGVTWALLTYLLFALFGQDVSLGLGLVLDIAFGLIVGMISGVISVNVKKS